MSEQKDIKPLPDEYLQQFHTAAKLAMGDVRARRRWPESKWGSPVGALLLIAEIARLRDAGADMLAALLEVNQTTDGQGGCDCFIDSSLEDLVRAAIAKATGEP